MKFLRYLLFPVAILYDMVTRIRNYCFDTGLLKETSFDIPVVVVGNLSVGGTGKTPQIEYLIRLLKKRYKTAVLSRGYGRKTKDFLLVNAKHTAQDVGDEPLQYYKKFNNINVAVDADRVAGISKLVYDKGPEVILLDDAFQHRKVKGSFYILLTQYNNLFVDDFVLPTGNLRESSNGAKRANLIIVTKCPANLSKETKESIETRLQKFNKRVLFTTISYHSEISGSKTISINRLQDFEVLLITGIANPVPLLEFLSRQNVRYTHLKFADHHQFSRQEIQHIQNEYTQINASKKVIVTTEKDYVRLSNSIKDISFLSIKTSFLFEQQQEFDEMITHHIQQNQR